MLRLLIFLAAWALVLGACAGGDTSDTTTSTDTTSTTSTTSSTTTTSTTEPTTTTTEPGPELDASCTSPVGFTVSYPDTWEVNDGAVVPQCTMFDPNAFQVIEGTDKRVAAINIYVENVAFDTIISSIDPELERSHEEMTLDEFESVRIEREASGEGLVPQGTLITSYYVDLDDNGRTLVADTVDFETIEYQRATTVLDAMVRTLSIDIDQVSQVEPIAEFTAAPVTSSDFPGDGEPSLLTDVRHGIHDGFERVVFGFRGGSDLSYQVEYVDEAIPPSGNPVDIAGEHILSVTMTPASGVRFSGGETTETYTGPDRFEPSSPIIGEIVQVEDFENTLTWAIGLDTATEIAVEVLDDPRRLVIDIRSS